MHPQLCACADTTANWSVIQTQFIPRWSCHCGSLGKKHSILEENSSLTLNKIYRLKDASVTLSNKRVIRWPYERCHPEEFSGALWPPVPQTKCSAIATCTTPRSITVEDVRVLQVASWKCSYIVLQLRMFSFKRTWGLATLNTVLGTEVGKTSFVPSCDSLLV